MAARTPWAGRPLPRPPGLSHFNTPAMTGRGGRAPPATKRPFSSQLFSLLFAPSLGCHALLKRALRLSSAAPAVLLHISMENPRGHPPDSPIPYKGYKGRAAAAAAAKNSRPPPRPPPLLYQFDRPCNSSIDAAASLLHNRIQIQYSLPSFLSPNVHGPASYDSTYTTPRALPSVDQPPPQSSLSRNSHLTTEESATQDI